MARNAFSYGEIVKKMMKNIPSGARILYIQSGYPSVLSRVLNRDETVGCPKLRQWLGVQALGGFENLQKEHIAWPLMSVYNNGLLHTKEQYLAYIHTDQTDTVSRVSPEQQRKALENSCLPLDAPGRGKPVYYQGPNGFHHRLMLTTIDEESATPENLAKYGMTVVELKPDRREVCLKSRAGTLRLHYEDIKSEEVLERFNKDREDYDLNPVVRLREQNCKLFYLIGADAFEEKELGCMLRAFLESPIYPNAKLILTGATVNIPNALSGEVYLVKLPSPTHDDIVLELKQRLRKNLDQGSLTEDDIGKAADKLCGLTPVQLETIFATFENTLYAQIKNGGMQATIRALKELEADKDPTLSFLDVPEELSVVGIGGFNKWLNRRMKMLNDPASFRKLGIPIPKGIILTGVPGTGKSELAKQVTRQWGKSSGKPVSLIDLNIGNLSSKFVGESEQRMMHFLDRVEENKPTVLLLDEVEKTFNTHEMHEVRKQQMTLLLRWQNDLQDGIFTVMTSNDATVLPPELIRAGRFSERFFVFLPNATELLSILYLSLWKNAKAGVFCDDFNKEIEEICRVVEKYSEKYGTGSDEADADLDKELHNALMGGSLFRFLDTLVLRAMGVRSVDDAGAALKQKNWSPSGNCRTPFMTGADLRKSLLENTLLTLLRDGQGVPGEILKKCTAEMFVQALEKCSTDPDFRPYGQSNMGKIADLWLLCEYREVSAAPVLPRQSFDKDTGTFALDDDGLIRDGSIHKGSWLYDIYMQKVVRAAVEDSAKTALAHKKALFRES